MLRKFLFSSLGIALVHFGVVVLYANGLGGDLVRKIFDVIGEPGIYLARELGFGGFGFLDGLTGNPAGLWIVMGLNSLLWGIVIGTAISKLAKLNG